MKHTTVVYILSVVVIMSTVYSCSTQKKAAGRREQDKLEQAISQINNATQSIDAKYTIPVGSIKLKGQVRILEDSCIWLSAQFLGMEAGRALLTDNSAEVIYRLQRQYFRMEGQPWLSTVRNCANAILLHKIILPDGKKAMLSDFISVKQEDGSWQLIRHESFGDIIYCIDSQLQLTESRCTVNGHEAVTRYSVFEEGFPTHIAITAATDKLSTELVFNKIERNGKPDVNFSVPDGYQSAPIDLLYKMLPLK